MNSIDFNGIAAVLGAAGVFLGVVVSLVLQVINFVDARRAKRVQEQHKTLLCNISAAVGAKTDGGN